MNGRSEKIRMEKNNTRGLGIEILEIGDWRLAIGVWRLGMQRKRRRIEEELINQNEGGGRRTCGDAGIGRTMER